MSAIITDYLKIQNCENFISDIKMSEVNPDSKNYYIFIGFPNNEKYYSNWDSNIQSPTDNITYLNSYRESILGVKRISSSDVIRVIPKIEWKTGIRYDMYRHDYSSSNPAKNTGGLRLYDANYYVITDEYKVYICINNGANIVNSFKGNPSTIKPEHTDSNEYIDRGDGYVWKYLYTVSPGDAIKFDSTNYISVPNNWMTSNSSSISEVRDSAIDGSIRAIVIEKPTKYLNSSNSVICDIKGDGTGATAAVQFDSEGYPSKVTILTPGYGYTYATLDLDSVVSSYEVGNKSIFNVIIPPSGGHGYNLYQELGAYRALIYSRIENSTTDPDFIIGNQFSRVGIIKNLKSYGSGSGLFNGTTGSGLYGLALSGNASSESLDVVIEQSNTNAKGFLTSKQVVSSVTFIKYIQPRENYVDNYYNNIVTRSFDPYINANYTGLSTSSSYTFSEFNNDSIKIYNSANTSFNTYSVTSITGNQYNGTYLGQYFSEGVSKPDINIKSGDILYVDNRSSVTRQIDQREDIKIIIEF